MRTPPTTIAQLNSPRPVVLQAITTHCDPRMPELRLPPALATTEVLYISKRLSTECSSPPNLLRARFPNPHMSLLLHSPVSTSDRSSTHQHVVQESISVLNSAHELDPPQQPLGRSALLSVESVQQSPTNIVRESSEAYQ